MADDRNFWGVIGDVAGQAAQDIPRWQQSKLDARHKAHLDALAQRHAQEQYEAQMRGLDIREQQALAQQHAQEARESYNQSRLDQIDRQFGETERRNRATEEIAGLRESRIEAKQMPDFLGLGRTALQSATDRWRAGKANRVVGNEGGSAVYGPDPYFNEPEPTWTTPGAGGGPSIIQTERSNAEKWGQDPDALEYQLTGKYPNAAGLLKRLGVTNVPRLNYGPSAQPSRGITPQRSEAGMGAVGQQRQRRQFGDGSVAELNPVTGKWEVVQ